jgi:hypothetical protein
MWYWRMMEKTSLTDRVRNEEKLDSVTGDTSILHTIKIKTGNSAGDMLRKCILKHVTEG